MIRLSIVFIIQQRHHYNKAMLSNISDWLHYETVLPEWTPTSSRYLNVLSEKKVEVFHSLLRMQCPSWASAQQIEEFAHVLSAKKFNTARQTFWHLQQKRLQNRTCHTWRESLRSIWQRNSSTSFKTAQLER